MSIDKSVFVHPMAFVSGEVMIGQNSSIWPGAVIRGDLAPVTIGKYTNIQDNAVIHVDSHAPVNVGSYVTVGHSAVLHGCRIADRVIIGMNATVLDGAKVAQNCIIAANALIRQNEIIPENSLVVGVPGEIKHMKTDPELIMRHALMYYELSGRYLKGKRTFPASEVDNLIATYKDRGLL
jgi:carbonic anhydrase/acetyltransferase-like protein (isoleucine patch superfamily)